MFSEPVSPRAYQFASLLKRLALFPRSLCLTYAQFQSPGTSLTYIGEGESLPYLREILEVGQLKEWRIAIWNLHKVIRQLLLSGTWLCVEIDRLLVPFVSGGEMASTYPWIRQRIYLGNNQYRERKRQIEDNFGRKVRKYRYSFRLVHGDGVVERFYSCLYLPHIKARFGTAANPRSESELKKFVKNGFLLQVLCEDQWIAGAVCTAGNREISARAFGHLPEGKYSLSLGGLSATYYYILRYAVEHNLDYVDLLRSRPNSADGVYCHKKRWGAVAEIDSWPHTAILFFSGQGVPVPEKLKTLLVWDGVEFKELRDSCSNSEVAEIAGQGGP